MAEKNSIPKYLLNSLDVSVHDNLVGLALTNINVQVTDQVDAIVRKDVHILRNRNCVLLVSGGEYFSKTDRV